MKRQSGVVTAIGSFLIILFVAGPVVLSLIGSVIPDRLLFGTSKSIFEEGLSLENYRYIFTGELPSAYRAQGANRTMISDTARQVPESLLNSCEIALAVMALNLILGTPAAFLFARYFFPAKRLSFLFLILSPLVPSIALITPIYMMVEAAGLIGSKIGIIFIHTAKALPFTVLILSVFFRKLPRELFESAVIDGCSRFQTFVRVALPLAVPSLAATGLFAFMLSYAEFLFSLVLSGGAGARPLSVVMAALARNVDVSWSLLNAGIFIAIIPTLILVVLIWRLVMEDLVRGAVKG
jgi:ABC-type glycerol-3-phosphate transport system permease component